MICRYMSFEEMPDEMAPRGVQYLAGWGYILSRDVAEHVLRTVDSYSRHPETQPGTFLISCRLPLALGTAWRDGQDTSL